MQGPFSADSFRTCLPPRVLQWNPTSSNPARPPVGYLARRRILQLDESLADRLAADAEAGRHLLPRQALAGWNLQLHDRELEGARHLAG